MTCTFADFHASTLAQPHPLQLETHRPSIDTVIVRVGGDIDSDTAAAAGNAAGTCARHDEHADDRPDRCDFHELDGAAHAGAGVPAGGRTRNHLHPASADVHGRTAHSPPVP